MEKDSNLIDKILLHKDKPTEVTIEELFTWVIWQFPNGTQEAAFGAVHPPEEGHGWFPVMINQSDNKISIFGNLENQFPSPEDVSTYFSEQKKK